MGVTRYQADGQGPRKNKVASRTSGCLLERPSLRSAVAASRSRSLREHACGLSSSSQPRSETSILEGSSVDDIDIKGKRVQIVDAAKIDTVVPWSRWSLIVGRYGSDRVERSDPARSTEAVLHVLVPELVHGEVFAALDLDLRRSEVTGGHDHAFADADGAVTSAPCRDLLARELEADRAAMATGVVGLRSRNHRLHPFTRRRAGPENSSRATSLGRSIPIGPQGASAKCNATSGIGRPPR
jgi:hypothetical protein